MFSTGYRRDGFLAYLSYNIEGNTVSYIPFNRVEYNDGNNYNPASGIYTVPRDGFYLVHARVYGHDNMASHYIKVNGVAVTYTKGFDPGHQYQSASTSIVLHLLSDQVIGVDPQFSGTVDGDSDVMTTSFGAMLLFAD